MFPTSKRKLPPVQKSDQIQGISRGLEISAFAAFRNRCSPCDMQSCKLQGFSWRRQHFLFLKSSLAQSFSVALCQFVVFKIRQVYLIMYDTKKNFRDAAKPNVHRCTMHTSRQYWDLGKWCFSKKGEVSWVKAFYCKRPCHGSCVSSLLRNSDV